MERRENRRFVSFMLKQEDGGFIPVYMFDHGDEKSIPALMLDISSGGCRLLIPKGYSALPEKIQLQIMGTDQSVKEETILFAKECWCDKTYSIDHQSVGLQFSPFSDQENFVDNLIKSFNEHQEKQEHVRCLLTPAR